MKTKLGSPTADDSVQKWTFFHCFC